MSPRGCRSAYRTRIETPTHGPVIASEQKVPHHGQISLVDSVIRFKRPGPNVAVDTNAGLTLHNVYIEGGATIVRGPSGAELTAEQPGWLQVREFALGVAPPPTGRWTGMPGIQYQAALYVDGQRLDRQSIADIRTGIDSDTIGLQSV